MARKRADLLESLEFGSGAFHRAPDGENKDYFSADKVVDVVPTRREQETADAFELAASIELPASRCDLEHGERVSKLRREEVGRVVSVAAPPRIDGSDLRLGPKRYDDLDGHAGLSA